MSRCESTNPESNQLTPAATPANHPKATSLAATTPMDDTTQDEFQITYTDQSHTTRRLRFEPRDADANEWWRIEVVWTGCRWRPVGRERVTNLSVETTQR